MAAVCLATCFFAVARMEAAPPPPNLSGTQPRAYTVKQERGAGRITLSTPYYVVRHNLKQGGAIAGIQLIYGRATNLLVEPLGTMVRDEKGEAFTDLNDAAPRVTCGSDGLIELVTIESQLLDAERHGPGFRLKTVFEYHWGYIKIHKELAVPRGGARVREVCLVSTVLAPSLASYGYREGKTESEGAPAFSFGSCRWGKLNAAQVLDTPYVPRYMMFANPGVEGLEWFVGSDLSQWDLQLAGRRGQGRCVFEPSSNPAGLALDIAPFQGATGPILLAKDCAFDYYVGLPILEGHARKPWFHASFNRNRGNWVTAQQIQGWKETGIQTVHCHNDGDYYDDGLFWRDGSYPPYPDMENYDRVIAQCHRAGIRVATYFSNKELHPSTKEFQDHGAAWGRKDLQGDLQHNFFRGSSEFGAQMCLHSGWLNFLKASIDRVLAHHPLDGVYYDWNVALLCCNGLHEGKAPGLAGAGHWDIDELLDLMEWTRRRVGPAGLIIIHNTTTPMFSTENFADYVVANEWGYGKWPDQGVALEDLPLEWSLVGARSRGVISYGQLTSQGPRRLHRLFALEALLAGVTPWPASPETFELFPVLNPLGDLETCRFADWHNGAVEFEDPRCASAIYSRANESFLILANLNEQAREVRCRVHPERLPWPRRSLATATFLGAGAVSNVPPARLASQLLHEGAKVLIPGDSAVAVRIR